MSLRSSLSARGAVVAGLVAITLGCSKLTDVDASDNLALSDLSNPDGAAALFNGANALFATAYNGTTSTVLYSGLLADELINSSFLVDLNALDTREADADAPISGLYSDLSQARVNALGAAQLLQRVGATPRARIGRAFALVGYTEVLLSEFYCSGISLTEVVDGRPATYGDPLTTTKVLEHAVAMFDSGLVYAADSVRILNVARIGRGRALLDLGRFAEAAQAVAAVPTSYRYVTEHSAAVAPNRLNVYFVGGVVSVANVEGQNGLNFRTTNDPRVVTALQRLGTDNQTPSYAWTPAISGGMATPTVLASGIEARLIEAEASQRANPGNVSATGWLGILNTLRATAITPAMASLPDPGSAAPQVDLLFRERAFWLFLTAHRHGDLRRLVRQYGRNAQTVFPTGSYPGGRQYDTHVAAELPQGSESRNPKYVGCLDLSA